MQNAAIIDRHWKPALLRGWSCTCPACGKGRLFTAYLKVADTCRACGAELHHHRADDFPPYITIMIVGHVIVPLLLLVEKTWHPELWIHAILWFPLTFALAIWLLPRVKGAVIGVQWANRMHGFGENSQTPPSP
jgi:uncharacterized protein (DUF983 family)